MNIEYLARKAIDRIKKIWGIPKSGFIAGGSISNIIWEFVSGNKAIVNDIDIFILDDIISADEVHKITSTGKKITYFDKDIVYIEDYGGLSFKATPNEFYTIVSSEKDGIFNYIHYRSSTINPSIVINSFDINCTSIGYSIDEDKFYWLDSFEDFLKTGELKVTSLATPCHTAIRIGKKQDDLNAKLDKFEYSLLSYAINNRFIDTNKTKFSSRYLELYKKYKDKIPSYFLERREDTELFLSSKGINIELYTLTVKKSSYREFGLSNNRISHPSEDDGLLLYGDNNVSEIKSSKQFLFYMRNIYINNRLKSIWSKTKYFFNSEEYIDVNIIDQKSLDRLSKLALFAPNTIENLRGNRLSHQLEFINKLFDKFKNNPLIGISILEKHKMNDIDLDDDQLLLILELSVRKQIISDPSNKVNKILNNKYSDIDNAVFFL
jgi:hypothetical protein